MLQELLLRGVNHRAPNPETRAHVTWKVNRQDVEGHSGELQSPSKAKVGSMSATADRRGEFSASDYAVMSARIGRKMDQKATLLAVAPRV